ncbi:MAG: winged helix-turn-helix transcriptional regulator [Burkholderiaceae bacterium]
MTTPRIGHAVRGSRTGRPIMVVLDLLGRRTALRVLWELRAEPATFRALQDACETNARLLNTRLSELREAGLVEHAAGGYRLTEQGRQLGRALEPLSRWAAGWARHRPTSG